MRYFANPSTPSVRDAMTAGLIDFIATPNATRVSQRVEGVTWCADNGCFSDKWDAEAWWAWLVANAGDADTCAFAVAPDVVGDALATLERAKPWLYRIRELGYPVAYVAQNGAHDVPIPWTEIDVLFLGGSPECIPCGYVFREPRKPERREPCPTCGLVLTEWKLGAVARQLATQARAYRKGVHMGRVSSLKRLRYAEAIGCDSVDGTFLVFGPDKNLPRLTAWLTELRDQRPLLYEETL